MFLNSIRIDSLPDVFEEREPLVRVDDGRDLRGDHVAKVVDDGAGRHGGGGGGRGRAELAGRALTERGEGLKEKNK